MRSLRRAAERPRKKSPRSIKQTFPSKGRRLVIELSTRSRERRTMTTGRGRFGRAKKSKTNEH
jgi:hypothetical protein